MNLSIAYSVAAEFSMDSMVLQETASPRSYKVVSQQNSLVLNFSVNAPSGLTILVLWPAQICVQVILFLVNVPVLSEQILLAPPMVSHEESFLTKF